MHQVDHQSVAMGVAMGAAFSPGDLVASGVLTASGSSSGSGGASPSGEYGGRETGGIGVKRKSDEIVM